ncbi:hypothetical protein BaRGS_00011313, partial [Batillaria attramentaria]
FPRVAFTGALFGFWDIKLGSSILNLYIRVCVAAHHVINLGARISTASLWFDGLTCLKLVFETVAADYTLQDTRRAASVKPAAFSPK